MSHGHIITGGEKRSSLAKGRRQQALRQAFDFL